MRQRFNESNNIHSAIQVRFPFEHDGEARRLLKRQSPRIFAAKSKRRLTMPEQNTDKTSAAANAADKLESSKTHARKAAEDIKSAAGDLRSAAGAIAGEYRGRAEEAWGEARGKAEQAWGEARERVRTFQDDAEEYVRENPTKAVFTALGIGFVLGLIFRR
jgi:ElaB/YqjD/DUF883 family membrane-anchored ribosome-binding protein